MEDMNRIINKSTVRALTIGEAIHRLTQLVVSGVPESSILNCPAKRAAEIAVLKDRMDKRGTVTSEQAKVVSDAHTTFWVEYILGEEDEPRVYSDSLPSKDPELTRAIQELLVIDEEEDRGVFVSDAYKKYVEMTLAADKQPVSRDAFKIEVYRQGFVLDFGRLPGVKLA